MTDDKPKKASYPATVRKAARTKGCGLARITYEDAEGNVVVNEVAPIGPMQGRFLKWAAAILFCEQLRGPDLEAMVRRLLDDRGA